jgi:hypothetical protein
MKQENEAQKKYLALNNGNIRDDKRFYAFKPY